MCLTLINNHADFGDFTPCGDFGEYADGCDHASCAFQTGHVQHIDPKLIINLSKHSVNHCSSHLLSCNVLYCIC